MDDFTYDIIQKKRIAGGARHRKCGSKSRKCSMSSDRMTQKQWRERCGDVVSYQLGIPIEWNQFKLLPHDIQKIYLDGLMEKFHPTASDLSKVFGATATTVTHYLRREFDMRFSPGKQMPKDRVADFKRFLSGQSEDIDDEELSPEALQASDVPVVVPYEKPNFTQIRSTDLSIIEFSLSFSGSFDAKNIHNSIASIVPDGTDVKIDIHCIINKQ